MKFLALDALSTWHSVSGFCWKLFGIFRLFLIFLTCESETFGKRFSRDIPVRWRDRTIR